jgi:hypothetical protein
VGFFKDINKLQKQGKEMKKDWDPGQQARDATERMKAMNQQMAASNAAATAPPGDSIDATAQVVSVGMTQGMMNMDPILPVEFLVTQPGRPPMPVSATVIVPMANLSRVQAGVTLPVKMSQSNPSSIFINWAAAT